MGRSVGKMTIIIISFSVGASKNKDFSTHIISTCVKSMKATRFIYFDLKSKVVVINIMSMQVTYEREITLYLSDVKYAEVFLSVLL